MGSVAVGGQQKYGGRGALQSTAAITQPAEEGFGDQSQRAWRRMVDGGVEQASDIWASVNSAAAAAAKGTWEGIKPVKKVLFSDVLASPKRPSFARKWANTDITYATFIGAMHLGCLAAPFTFSWSAFNCFLVMYFITGCLGITLSYHRQLSHKVRLPFGVKKTTKKKKEDKLFLCFFGFFLFFFHMFTKCPNCI